MKLHWTRKYCNMQYLDAVDDKKLPRNVFIALRHGMLNDNVLVSYTDLDKNKTPYSNESNFGTDKEFYGPLDEAIKIVETWK